MDTFKDTENVVWGDFIYLFIFLQEKCFTVCEGNFSGVKGALCNLGDLH